MAKLASSPGVLDGKMKFGYAIGDVSSLMGSYRNSVFQAAS